MRNPDRTIARRLLRLKPAAEYLSLGAGTLRALCQRGEIPVIRLSDSGTAPWLIDIRDLDLWIERTKGNL